MPEIKQSYYLQQAFNFTDADLKANRSGKITRKQISHVLKSELPALFLMLFLLIALSGVFIYSVESIVQRFLIFIISAPVFLALYSVLGITLNLYDDLRNGKVATEVNIVHKLNTGSYKNPVKWHSYNIKPGEDNPALSVTESGYRILKEGSYYTVNYLPKSRIVLSVEEAPLSIAIREIKDDLKYLDSQEAMLKAKNDDC